MAANRRPAPARRELPPAAPPPARPPARPCAVYELDGPGRDGKVKLFEKPWAMSTVMFLGMTFCLPLAYWAERKEARRRKAAAAAGEAAEPLLGDGGAGAVSRGAGDAVLQGGQQGVLHAAGAPKVWRGAGSRAELARQRARQSAQRGDRAPACNATPLPLRAALLRRRRPPRPAAPARPTGRRQRRCSCWPSPPSLTSSPPCS